MGWRSNLGYGRGPPRLDHSLTLSSSSSSSSSRSNSSSPDGDADSEEEVAEELERWVAFIKRIRNLAANTAREAGVVDWVEKERCRKWQWAEHLARTDGGRWSRCFLD